MAPLRQVTKYAYSRQQHAAHHHDHYEFVPAVFCNTDYIISKFSVILFLFNFSSEFLTMLPVSARPALPVLLPDSSQSW